MARAKQPGLLVVDRTIHGKYENYQTPEQKIPEHQLPDPWESCVTLTTDWGWVKNPVYKPPNRIISILMEVVAKGGNLLLGVGPTAEGLIEQPTVKRLQDRKLSVYQVHFRIMHLRQMLPLSLVVKMLRSFISQMGSINV